MQKVVKIAHGLIPRGNRPTEVDKLSAPKSKGTLSCVYLQAICKRYNECVMNIGPFKFPFEYVECPVLLRYFSC